MGYDETPKQPSIISELESVQLETFTLLSKLEDKLRPISYPQPKADQASVGKAIVEGHLSDRLSAQYNINSILRDIVNGLAV